MFKVFDAYSLKARLFPALLAVIPALAALAILISWNKFGLTSAIATTAIPVLVFAAADIARRLGKRLEEQLYQEQGGKPSVSMLRYSDNTLDAATKAQYRAFLSSKIGQPAPTEQEERDNAKSADAFYERGGGWLRENTRNAKKFPILFSENVTYGYRRNLLGLKLPALGLNALMVVLCLFVLYRRGIIDTEDDVTVRLLIVLAFAVIHAIYMMSAVSKRSVVDASETYARQLLLSCETFIGKEHRTANSATASRGRKRREAAGS
ncbi:hypothetical protein [Bradyrhizobium japonicum]|uniref:hypothetical protein n=1 Tax=Bradyrhizobium japonicum TaxID=375 RepID=UPI0019117F19|nr:hypothetical protein [Bradyrhizobium japonicum]